MTEDTADDRSAGGKVAATRAEGGSADALARVMRDTIITAAATILQSPFIGDKDQLVRLIQRHGECLARCLPDLVALRDDRPRPSRKL